MADVPLSGIIGGGGLLATSTYGGGTISSGTTADVTISCPLNKFLRLTLLYAFNAQPGVTITFGARDVVTGTVASVDSFTPTAINVGNPPQTNGDNGTALQAVKGKRNEDLIFSFASTTTQPISYCYEVLEDA